MSTADLLVVGGGVTGLSAAWEATQHGARVVLVEASPRLGGKIHTERIDGLTIEHGPDSFVAYRPAALTLAHEAGLADEIVSVDSGRTVHIRAGGRLHPMPDGMGMVLPTQIAPFLRTSILRPRDKLRAGLDLVLPRRLGADDEAIGRFLRARLGPGLVDRLAQPLVGGIYGASLDELSLDALMPSLRAAESECRSLLLAGLAQGRAARTTLTTTQTSARTAPAGARSPFRSLAHGMGSLVDALVASLREHDVEFRCGRKILSIDPRSDGSVEVTDSAGRIDQVGAIVLAAGTRASADIVSPHAPAAAAALREIQHGSSTVVTLAWPAESFATPPTSHGWLEAEPAPVSGVTISSAKWPGRAPAGVVLVRAFVPGRVGPLAAAPDAEVAARVAAHVGAVLGIRGAPSTSRVSRWQDVMPVYAVGHLARAARADAGLAHLPAWRLAGADLHGVGVPDCVADGRKAAREALGVGAAAGGTHHTHPGRAGHRRGT